MISYDDLLRHSIVRLKLKHDSPGINLARFSTDNHVTCCVATPDCRSLILGSRSGIVFVQKCNPMPEKVGLLLIIIKTKLDSFQSLNLLVAFLFFESRD